MLVKLSMQKWLFQLICILVITRTTLGFNTSLSNSTVNATIIQQEYNSNNFHYKGVALGGWLVLEPYITPSLFLAFNESKNSTEADIPIDEYHYCKMLGQEEAKKRLTEHWNTWYNESDFAKMKEYGLNMVRIPIGYWAFEKLKDDPYVSGAQEYLDKALAWSKKYDLKVWIDLHGHPGSQNGFDNSGYRDIGYPGWFNKTEYWNVSHNVLNQIYTKYGTSDLAEEYKDTILGIEVVNEPLSTELSIDKIKKFYSETYSNAREIQQLNNTIVFHDAFKQIGYWNSFLSKPGNMSNSSASNYNILIDHHHYEVFDSNQLNLTIEGHLNSIRDYSSSISDELDYHPALVGEWSAALTDCTPWLNGVGLGSRYEGTAPYTNRRIGDCSNINNWASWNTTTRKNYRKFIEMQLSDYSSKTMGWIFWCFKTETTIEWDFDRLVNFGLVPQPLDNYTYIINGTDIDNSTTKENSSGRLSYSFNSILFILISVALLI